MCKTVVRSALPFFNFNFLAWHTCNCKEHTHIQKHVYIHNYTHTSINPSIHPSLHAYINSTYIRTRVPLLKRKGPCTTPLTEQVVYY